MGQHFPGTENLVLALGDKHSTVQCKHRNEVKKGAWATGDDQDHQTSTKPSDPF